jgi:hypothetical protein
MRPHLRFKKPLYTSTSNSGESIFGDTEPTCEGNGESRPDAPRMLTCDRSISCSCSCSWSGVFLFLLVGSRGS